jgi:hypothetical protein
MHKIPYAQRPHARGGAQDATHIADAQGQPLGQAPYGHIMGTVILSTRLSSNHIACPFYWSHIS